MSNFITVEGLAKLKEELAEIKLKLKEVALKIKEAREFGDLSENAEYHEAKNEQSFLVGREQEIEFKIKNAEIIETKACDKSVVTIGCTVEILDDGEKVIYQIVGSEEADPLNGRISIDSPVGRAVVGAKKGDNVKVTTPAGVSEFKIVDIR
ncbi:MAG: transcription elongation factor GreA [Candidatus Berkelbacteria bacterium]